ncbi:DUF3800 domain-containing protein [Candidatus Margulisiibacteriota bacterium]
MIKQAKDRKMSFFVDESGDPTFYNRYGKYIVGGEKGSSKILILGTIKTEHPEDIRKALSELRKEVAGDEYLREIPSVKKSVSAFHATDDCSEIREKVFKTIHKLPFKSEIVVARKKERIFIGRHNRDENVFYDDLISKLFQNQLHRSSSNVIYFSKRGNRPRQSHLENAIQSAINTFESKWKTKIDTQVIIYAQRPEGEACLQVIDYINWSIQRLFLKGEDRFFNFIKNKVSLVIDLYDFDKYPDNYYNRRNVLESKKLSPL